MADERNNFPGCEFTQKGFLGERRCPHPGEFKELGGRRLCIFHWEPEEGGELRTKLGLFQPRFAELVFRFGWDPDKPGVDLSGLRLDCRGFVFPADLDYLSGRTVPPADFHYARFGAGARFTRSSFAGGARFHWVTFDENVSFDNADFGEGASFAGAIFGEGASFDRASFGEGASFIRTKFNRRACFFGTRFGRGVIFDGAEFAADATFLGVRFGEDASFERTRFGENALFVESAFEDGAWFTDAAFEAGAEFCRSEFRGSASFEGAQAGGSLRFSGAETGTRMFGGGKCVVNLENMILACPGEVSFSSVNLQRISFFGTDLSKISFERVSWPEDKAGNLSFLGRIEAGAFEVRPGVASLTWLEGLCRQLRENFEARPAKGATSPPGRGDRRSQGKSLGSSPGALPDARWLRSPHRKRVQGAIHRPRRHHFSPGFPWSPSYRPAAHSYRGVSLRPVRWIGSFSPARNPRRRGGGLFEREGVTFRDFLPCRKIHPDECRASGSRRLRGRHRHRKGPLSPHARLFPPTAFPDVHGREEALRGIPES